MDLGSTQTNGPHGFVVAIAVKRKSSINQVLLVGLVTEGRRHVVGTVLTTKEHAKTSSDQDFGPKSHIPISRLLRPNVDRCCNIVACQTTPSRRTAPSRRCIPKRPRLRMFCYDKAMTDPVIEPLILDLLEWLANGERTYEEVMDTWRTSCPRLTVWEDATDRGLIANEQVNGRTLVRPSPSGLALLRFPKVI